MYIINEVLEIAEIAFYAFVGAFVVSILIVAAACSFQRGIEEIMPGEFDQNSASNTPDTKENL